MEQIPTLQIISRPEDEAKKKKKEKKKGGTRPTEACSVCQPSARGRGCEILRLGPDFYMWSVDQLRRESIFDPPRLTAVDTGKFSSHSADRKTTSVHLHVEQRRGAGSQSGASRSPNDPEDRKRSRNNDQELGQTMKRCLWLWVVVPRSEPTNEKSPETARDTEVDWTGPRSIDNAQILSSPVVFRAGSVPKGSIRKLGSPSSSAVRGSRVEDCR